MWPGLWYRTQSNLSFGDALAERGPPVFGAFEFIAKPDAAPHR